MSSHNSLAALFQDIAQSIRNKSGNPSQIVANNFPETISAIESPAVLEVGATTVRISSSTTENVASNDNIRILGSDMEKYTIAEWNAKYVEAGYNRNAMVDGDGEPLSPVGINIRAFGIDESYMFSRYTGTTYNIVGDAQGAEGKLQHSIYNHNLVTAVGSGTDSTTGKDWSVTALGDNYLTLYEANTKQSWNMAKNCGAAYQHKSFNPYERTHSLYVQTEWLRHRFAIPSGVMTDEEDGSQYVGLHILNSSGLQAEVGEDMYFWLEDLDSGTYTNTGKLAKYNLNNRHGVSGYSLTQAIADAIYDRQVANGINMNDTGVNSGLKPVLSDGSKGAEAIAVDGQWYIITPYISNPNAATATATNNMADSPAVYWATSKGFMLPSDSLLHAMYQNFSLLTALRNYLVNKEGWVLDTIPTNDYCWSTVRYSATTSWFVYLTAGSVNYTGAVSRFFVVGASAS